MNRPSEKQSKWKSQALSRAEHVADSTKSPYSRAVPRRPWGWSWPARAQWWCSFPPEPPTTRGPAPLPRPQLHVTAVPWNHFSCKNTRTSVISAFSLGSPHISPEAAWAVLPLRTLSPRTTAEAGPLLQLMSQQGCRFLSCSQSCVRGVKS